MQFDHTRLEWKLKEKMVEAVEAVNSASSDNILSCDEECLSKTVANISLPIPALDSVGVYGENQFVESEEITFRRKTGVTHHSFFISVIAGDELLEGIEEQQVPPENYPLAFLDQKRQRLEIRLSISPDDEDGALKGRLESRVKLAVDYANEVANVVGSFNSDMERNVRTDFSRRKNSILKAVRELESLNLPLKYNPEHEEWEESKKALLQRLKRELTPMDQNSTERKLHLVLAAMNDVAKEQGSPYVDEEKVVQQTGLDLNKVRDLMDLLAGQSLTTPSNSSDGTRCAMVTALGRVSLEDPKFRTDSQSSTTHIYSGVQSVHHGSGDISGNIQNLNSTLENVIQTINESPQFQPVSKAELAELIKQLFEELQKVPPERGKEAKAFGDATKKLVEEAEKEEPDFFSMRITAEGLKAAAKNLVSVAPNAVTTISKIVPLVLGNTHPI